MTRSAASEASRHRPGRRGRSLRFDEHVGRRASPQRPSASKAVALPYRSERGSSALGIGLRLKSMSACEAKGPACARRSIVVCRTGPGSPRLDAPVAVTAYTTHCPGSRRAPLDSRSDTTPAERRIAEAPTTRIHRLSSPLSHPQTTGEPNRSRRPAMARYAGAEVVSFACRPGRRGSCAG